ncbi:hypothetical protein BIY23_02750 [Wolbachia pipientis]|uniref:Uncharacterized protein n=1 Tax=Wolbachia pipientis TaxID=955 RepID=A0A1E7QJF9_WOLPI|nr:ankyrin repeat domain-containing protein [Wolbachia pipientis]OEY86603.1 hypothetical protein BIY23_02750 [Wolbachia pipientis]
MKYTKHNLKTVLKELSQRSFQGINKKDTKGDTVLHLAVKFTYAKTVKLLIARGADVNSRGSEKETPLHKATLLGRVQNVKLLIEKGADVNAKNHNGYTAIHLACMLNYENVVKELLKANANVNILSNLGFSPLFLAKSAESTPANYRIIKLLEKKLGYRLPTF